MNDVSRDEFRVLRAILTNEFHSEPPGKARIGSAVFCASLDTSGEPCGVEDGKVLRALISSLVDKKLVVSGGETIALTTAATPRRQLPFRALSSEVASGSREDNASKQ